MTVTTGRRHGASTADDGRGPAGAGVAAPTIQVYANTTIDELVERVRQLEALEVVLEVAPDSPVLLSLPDVDRLEAAMAERGTRFILASTSSRHLNAALLFGWTAFDRRHVADDQPCAENRQHADGDNRQPAFANLLERPDTAARTASRHAVPGERTPQLPTVDAVKPEGSAADFGHHVPSGDDATPGYQRAAGEIRRIRPARPFHDYDATTGRVAGSAVPEDAAGSDGPSASPPPPWRPCLVPVQDSASAFDALRAWLRSTRRAAIQVVPAPLTPPVERVKRPDVIELPEESDEAAGDAPASAPEPARASRAHVAAPSGARELDTATDLGSESVGSNPTRPGVLEPRSVVAPPRRWWRWLGLLAVFLALVALSAAAFYFAAARATVTLVARTSTIAVSFNVVVAEVDPKSPQGAPTQDRIIAPARRLRTPVEAFATVPASGVRYLPVVTAGGPVLLSNASTGPVSVPMGTSLTADDGRVYITTEPATVPPADPYDAAQFGTVIVRVAAESPGSAGNASAGALRGRLPSGIYYNNRGAPIAGGADRAIPVITGRDLAAARAAAERLATDKGAAAIAAVLPAGYETLADTTGVGDFAATFTAPEGSDGESVGATVRAVATALVFNPADVATSAQAELEARLKAAVPTTDEIIPGASRVGAPLLIGETPGVKTYAVQGSARTRTRLGSEAERARLQRQLANRDDSAARRLLAALPGVASFTVDYGPSWAPRRMPWRATRIDVRFAEPAD